MKEEDKFYIPDISEFHLGFIFDIYEGNDLADPWEWTTKDFSINIIDKNKFNFSLEFLFRKLKSNEIRVSFLDKQDIESLGFIYTRNYKQFIYFDYRNTDEYGGGFLNYNLDTKVLKLSINNGETDRDGLIYTTRFEGVIKNKSELVQLLKKIE